MAHQHHMTIGMELQGRLLSTHGDATNVELLELSSIVAAVSPAKKLKLAFGFYDVDFVKKLLLSTRKAGKLKSVQMIFNGLSGARLAEQIDELRKLKVAGVSLDIRLRRVSSGLFHTKLVLAGSEKSSRCAFVGSANATLAAMERNEEIFLELVGDLRPLDAYFDDTWERAAPLDELRFEEPPSRSLVSFFRTGVLYFKPTATVQYTFNPLAKSLAQLPPSTLRKFSGPTLPFADPQTGVGPFNVLRAIELNDAVEDGQRSTGRSPIKPYSIETYFGYWVPSFLEEHLRKGLDSTAKKKSQRLRNINEQLQSVGRATVLSRYKKYLSAAKKALATQPGSTRILEQIPEEVFTNTEPFQRFLDRLMTNLDDEGYRDRLSYPFIDGPMPEIWDDRKSARMFEDTFFEYLAYIAQRSGYWPRAAARILARADYDEPTATAIRDAFEVYLNEEGWTEAHWK